MPNYSSLSEIYEQFVNSKGWKSRVFIKKGLKALDEGINNQEPTVVLLDLPTAYGKTTVTISLADAIANHTKLINRIIHILPMRSIADQLFNDIKERIGPKNQQLVALQHMGSPGSRFFTKKIIITTLDTFLLNFYKAPVAEIHRMFEYNEYSHFDFPRAMIYSSLIIFDEYHLFSPLGSLENEAKSFTSATYSVCTLATSGVPVIIMTATMPLPLKQILIEKCENYGISIKPIQYEKFGDRDYEEDRKDKKICLEIIDEKDVKTEVEKFLSARKKVLLIFNTVKEAFKCFSNLSYYKPILIHGKLPEITRVKRFEEFKNETPPLMISTQVVESGLNLSFDVLITDACPADRLIQRAGRVARFKEHDEGVVYFLRRTNGPYPYDEDITKRTYEEISKKRGISLSLDFYRQLLEKVYRDSKIEEQKNLWEALYYLDLPLFDSKDARKAIETFNGFTDSFGIISGYMENALDPKMSVGLSEEEAFHVLKKKKKVVNPEMKIETVPDSFLYSSKGISLKLLSGGYVGIIVDDFDPENGYIGDIE
ncbi:MAG: CRISPR-associated helicase Cas3' [Candidatus Bathyarchaeia archaeon]